MIPTTTAWVGGSWGRWMATARTFYLTDTLGSILASFNNAAGGASVKGNQVFGPYGTGRYSACCINTLKGFTGQYNDGSGLDYYHARYYDPVVGVFLSADTVDGNMAGMNPYAYVKGNPETMNDPTGHKDCAGCGILFGRNEDGTKVSGGHYQFWMGMAVLLLPLAPLALVALAGPEGAFAGAAATWVVRGATWAWRGLTTEVGKAFLDPTRIGIGLTSAGVATTVNLLIAGAWSVLGILGTVLGNLAYYAISYANNPLAILGAIIASAVFTTFAFQLSRILPRPLGVQAPQGQKQPPATVQQSVTFAAKQISAYDNFTNAGNAAGNSGQMTGGFAILAWPAEYKSSGVMTFVVNKYGTVRQKDLGDNTADAAKAITAYDPDSSWTKVQ